MNIYYFALNALLLLSAAVLLKHSWFRCLYFLQMFQQHGYKLKEFYDWKVRHFYTKVIIPEHYLFLIILFSLLWLMSERMTITTATLILSMFCLFWFSSTVRFKPEQNKKPLVFTSRMKRLAFILAAIILLMVFIIMDLSFTGRLLDTPLVIRNAEMTMMVADPYFLLFGLLLIDISIPLFLLFGAWTLKPLERRFHEGFKKRARSRLAAMPDLKVIAITGSYGKTSTKFLIHSLLKERFHVCVTPGSYNTPMGICKVINNDLEPRHQILILEMGARYEGNIRELCEIAKPDVSVITNIGKAHLETFGSREAIAREKSRLAVELKKGGILVLNADDEKVASLAGINREAEVILAGVERGSIRASGISFDEEGTQFTLHVDNQNGKPSEQKIRMQLLGVHNVHNFLLAAAVATRFGIRPGTIALAAQQVRPVEHRLELRKQGGLTIIDDAFNSNPEGAGNAVDILASFKTGRRIIITPGMVELGEIQDEENRKFGARIAEADLDLVILVGRRQTEPVLEGVRQAESGSNELDVRVVDSLFEANGIVEKYARDGDIILYENDLPDTYTEAT